MDLLVWIVAATVLIGLFSLRISGARETAYAAFGVLLVVLLTSSATALTLRFIAGQDCATRIDRSAEVEGAEALCRDAQGLDQSALTQYTGWVGDLVKGETNDLIDHNGVRLGDTLRERTARTGSMLLYAEAIALTIGVGLGLLRVDDTVRSHHRTLHPAWAAIPWVGLLLVMLWAVGLWSTVALIVTIVTVSAIGRSVVRISRRSELSTKASSVALVAAPVFIIGEALRHVFVVDNGWYDAEGYVRLNEGLAPHLDSMWLPSLVLGLAIMPIHRRQLDEALAATMGLTFVEAKRASGMPPRQIVLRHLVRPSSHVLIASLGLSLAPLLAGALIIEFTYDLEGMGSYLLESVDEGQFFTAQTVLTVAIVLFVLTRATFELLGRMTDPRLRISGPL